MQYLTPSTSRGPHYRKRSGSPTHSESGTLPASTAFPSHAMTQALSTYLQTSFLVSLIPSNAEFAEKEDTRQKLEVVAQKALPGARLLPFGSTANGFSLKASDMDLCCVLPDTPGVPKKPASDLVEILADAITKEPDMNCHVKALPRARIPIIKLTWPSSPSSPFGMSCDIGFENRLALENTRLLYTYAMVDSRLRTMVLFIKLWTKRRKINQPYIGTLSSYGYVLMVIYYLVHVCKDPVLPNLQLLPPLQPINTEDLEIDGHDVYFFDDTEALPAIWQTKNTDNVGTLLVGFFSYFARQFSFNTDVISIRSPTGIVSKVYKGWNYNREAESELYGGPRDLNRFCIEDPFQTEYNVARTVTRDGLFTMRHEIIRASKLLCGRTERVSSLVTELCEEREDVIIPCPPGSYSGGGRRQSAPGPNLHLSPRMKHADQFVYVDQQAAMEEQYATNRDGDFANKNPMNDFRAWVAQNAVTVPNTHRRPVNSYMSQPTRQTSQEYMSDYGQHNQYAYNRNGIKHWQRQSYASQQPRYQANNNYRRQQQSPNAAYMVQPMAVPTSSSLPGPTLERRSSWDGPFPTSTPIEPKPSTSYTGPVPTYQDPRPSVTAPTSPTVGSGDGRFRLPTMDYNHPFPPSQRSQSMDRRSSLQYYRPQSEQASVHYPGLRTPAQMDGAREEVRDRSMGAISFGNFSLGNVMDTALARAEDRRRKGFIPADGGHEVISFGDVRLIRRAKSASDTSSPISRVGPRKASALPLVVEAIEPIQRPGTPVDTSAVPSSGKEPFMPTPRSARLQSHFVSEHAEHVPAVEEARQTAQVAIVSTVTAQ